MIFVENNFILNSILILFFPLISPIRAKENEPPPRKKNSNILQ